MSGLQLASTFSGVGGIDLGFHAAGIPTRLLCEYDKHAASVLARRFPGIPIHPDVQELTADDLAAAGLVPERTILAGGFPCQDLSVAGARRGMGEGTRSGLYWHLDRLMAEFRPAWVVFENVPGLLSSNGGRDMGAVLGSLADRGYGFAYRVLDAQFFGVPQRRRRVVIVGRLGDSGAAPAQVLLEPEGGGWNPPAGFPTGPRAARDAARGAGQAGRTRVVPALRASNHYGDQDGAEGQLVTDGDVANALTAREGKGPDSDATTTLVVSTLQASGGDRGYRVDAEAAAGGHLVVQPLALRGREDGAQLEVAPEGSPAHAVRTPGGGSSHPMVAVTTLGDRTHTLTGEGHDASEDGTGRGTPIIAATLTAGTSQPGVNPPGRRQEDDHNLVATETTVRRLTPLECERLQGHPDNWTEGQADSHRYKQMGNGVAVPVFEWVAQRLAAIHDAALGGAA